MGRLLHALPCLLAVSACVHTGVETDVAPPKRWNVELDVHTETARSDGEPLDGALLALAGIDEVRRFSVRGERVLRHPDGSRGTRLEFSGEDPLDGRVVDLRHFESGEILALDWLEYAAGPGGGIDVISPIFALVSPKVPLLRRGQQGRMITAWPVQVGPDRKVTERIRTTWTHLGTARVGGRATHAFRYDGDWETTGEDAGHQPAVGVQGRGRASGSLWLDVSDLTVMAHEFDWERRLVLNYPRAPGDGLELVQLQRLSGRVDQLEAP